MLNTSPRAKLHGPALLAPLARYLIAVGATVALLVGSALAASVAANEHHRYKLIDIGTLGGLTSYEDVNGPGNQLLNNAGIVTSFADTAIPDPRASTPNLCYNPDCFLSHAFRWKDGVLTDLGALSGMNSSAAGAINARGWSVGQSQNGLTLPQTGFPQIRATLWRDGELIDLGTLGGEGSLAAYVNDAGQVIGVSANAVADPFSVFFGIIFGETQSRAFLWDKGIMRDLGTLGGPDAMAASGCENERSGFVPGSSFTDFTPNLATGIPTMDPFLWDNGTMTDLGTLGGIFGTAQCANNRGQVIGQSSLSEHPGACFTGEPDCHAFVWERGIMKDLGTLGGTFSVPIWLNNQGEAVGAATTPNDELFHAVLWKRGVISDLGTLDGDCFSQAIAINSKGQIVGQSFSCDFSVVRAVLWENGSIFDLNTLVPENSSLQLIEAFNINDRGEILGLGAPPGVQSLDFGGHIFLLMPCGTGNADCDGITHRSTLTNERDLAASSLSSPKGREIVAAWRARWAQRYHNPRRGASRG
jgi:probable HAF family extracellular repeat protein